MSESPSRKTPADRMLEIGIVCFPSFGGSGVVASELAMGLAERGHRIHLLASELPSRALGEQERVIFHPIRVPPYPLFEHSPYTLAVASRIFDLCKAHRLDLVQVHYAVPHAAAGYLARELLGADAPRLVTSLHGTDVTRVGADASYRSVTAAAIAASDGVTVPSDFLRQAAYQHLGLTPALGIEVLHNFVDTERFHPPADRDRSRLQALFPGPETDGPVLFHVSNFRQVKRTGDLVEVLARVRQHLPARLVLVGDGPERPQVEQRALALGLAEHVCFLGKRAGFAEYLQHADAFLLPSESESFGVAALEAMSSGVPVFAYRVGGLPEVVSPEVGRLVEPFDIDALAAAVCESVSDPATLERLGSAARARAVERFRQGPALDRWEAYFRRVLVPKS